MNNPRIKQAMRLRDRRGRQRQGRIIVDGIRESVRALRAGVEPVDVFLCEAMISSEQMGDIYGTLKTKQFLPTPVSAEVFQKLAFGHRNEGVVLVAVEPQQRLNELVMPPDGLVAVLEDVEKPGNLGAVLRTADAVGLSAVVLADPRTDLYNPNAIRASMGAIFRIPVCVATSMEVLAWLRQQNSAICAARVDGATVFHRLDYRSKTAFVLGSEANGLSDHWRGDDIVSVALPMNGIVDSLNVSVTASVLFYEAWRQRNV